MLSPLNIGSSHVNKLKSFIGLLRIAKALGGCSYPHIPKVKVTLAKIFSSSIIGILTTPE